MKKIGIDARLIRQTGVGVYIRNFLHFLPKFVPKDWEIIIYLMAEDAHTALDKRFTKKVANYRWHTVEEQVSFHTVIARDDLDLMHFTYFSYPVIYTRPFIATIHDLTPYLFKTGLASTKNSLVYNLKHKALTYVLKTQIRNARYIITPTKTVKQEITDNFPESDPKKIIPIYEGVDEELKKLKEKKPKIALPQKFFLYIGNFYPHKNVGKLIEAFEKVDKEYSLILVGPDDLFGKRLKRNKRTIFYHDATREELIYLYKHAQALVHPTLVEGFGLTLLEAAYFGTPIIASDIPVLEELYKGYYLPFDPKNANDITRAINDFVKNERLVDYSNLLKKYSFEEMTKEIVSIYKKSLI